MRKMLFLTFAAILVVLAMSSRSEAWFAYHYGGGYGGGYRYGGAYRYGGGYHYGGYHYGGYGGGGYHYGYVRRW